MKIKLYVNPIFIRNQNVHSKIMFQIEGIGWFGVFVNGQTGKTEKQAFEINNFNWSNVVGNDRRATMVYDMENLKQIWKVMLSPQQERLFKASLKVGEAFKYFVKKYNNQFTSIPNHQIIADYINSYTDYIIKFVTALHDGIDMNIDHRFESGILPLTGINTAEIKADTNVTTEVKENVRKSVAMFKLVNASNFSNLFENNIYPIVKSKNGYYTIKDNNGNEYTVRADRGKEINVYTDCPA